MIILYTKHSRCSQKCLLIQHREWQFIEKIPIIFLLKMEATSSRRNYSCYQGSHISGINQQFLADMQSGERLES